MGVVEAEGGAILIDSGIDDDTARRALKLLEGLEVKVIINTHAHADHCGGNAFIKKRTGAQIFAPEIEGCFIAHPFLEPSFLCSASPLAEMRNKFLSQSHLRQMESLKKVQCLLWAKRSDAYLCPVTR